MKKGEATRKRIVEEALQIFSVKGFYNTSIKDILEKTNLTKGGLYGHFSSKEEIWYAVYNLAVKKWGKIALEGIKDTKDPMEKVEKLIKNITLKYLTGDVFPGGAFFVPMLVELCGQSEKMCDCIWKGMLQYSDLMESWLIEANEKGLLKEGINTKDVARFLLITTNGATTLYVATKDPNIWRRTMSQLLIYLDSLKK